MGSIPGSVPFTGFVAPTDTADTYPVIDPIYGIDGLRSVADLTARNAIPAARRRYGMIVFVQSPPAYYQLNSDLTTWSPYGVPSYATFVLGLNSSVTVGNDKTNHYIVPRASNIIKAFATAKVGPVGDDLVVDINLNGTSLWNGVPANRLKIADGQTKGNQSSFVTTTAAESDELSIDVISVGSTTPGGSVTVQLLMLS